MPLIYKNKGIIFSFLLCILKNLVYVRKKKNCKIYVRNDKSYFLKINNTCFMQSWKRKKCESPLRWRIRSDLGFSESCSRAMAVLASSWDVWSLTISRAIGSSWFESSLTVLVQYYDWKRKEKSVMLLVLEPQL